MDGLLILLLLFCWHDMSKSPLLQSISIWFMSPFLCPRYLYDIYISIADQSRAEIFYECPREGAVIAHEITNEMAWPRGRNEWTADNVRRTTFKGRSSCSLSMVMRSMALLGNDVRKVRKSLLGGAAAVRNKVNTVDKHCLRFVW